MKKISSIFLLVGFLFVLVSCSYSGKNSFPNIAGGYWPSTDENKDEFAEIEENQYIMSREHPRSNISLSSNTSSYSMIRGYINEGKNISKDMVRIEEMVNFFNYEYNAPSDDQLFGFTTQVIRTPWNQESHLLLLGLQTKKQDLGDVPNNVVLLIDVSGSMDAPNKIQLVKSSLKMLVEQMKDTDKISIVTYANQEKVVLDGASTKDKSTIISKIDRLSARGATAGQKGLQMAYEVAEKNFIKNGNNRIILTTDGDFNLGISSTERLVEYISGKRESGIYFSAFGFGYGNYKDEKLEALAKAGNGTQYYIDDNLSAKKAFIDDIDGLLYTMARDAKAQISFNPEVVHKYRLIGYENRKLTEEEYEDETKDAGEIGSGLQVNAIYEVVLETEHPTQNFGTLEIKYKNVDVNDTTTIINQFDIKYDALTDTPSDDSLFISAVIEFGLILRDSRFKGSASIESIISRLDELNGIKSDEYKMDFVNLVHQYHKK